MSVLKNKYILSLGDYPREPKPSLKLELQKSAGSANFVNVCGSLWGEGVCVWKYVWGEGVCVWCILMA